MDSVGKSTFDGASAIPVPSYGEIVSAMETLRSEVESLSLEVESLSLEVESLGLENESLRMKSAEQEAKIKYYEEQIRLAAAKKYGASSEKNVLPEQLSIFNEAEKEGREEAKELTFEEIAYKRKRGGARKASSEKYEGLLTEEIHYELSKDERICERCGGEMNEMGTDVREEIAIIPVQIKLIKHVQHKYVCENEACADDADSVNIVKARAPEPPIPHSPAGASMIAHVMSRKYSEHVPLYRQEQQFGYNGIDIPRQNMANWVVQGAELMEPVYERLREFLVGEDYVHADESPLQVLSEPGKKATSKSYMWLYATGRFRRQIFIYEYTRSRSGEHPKDFLRGFSGYLHTDGYAAYGSVPDVTIMGCFSHARRGYVEALKALPKDAERSRALSAEGLAHVDGLFELERGYEGMTPEERHAARLEKSKPALDAYKEWLDERKRSALPQGKLGKAVNYSLNQWDKLKTFLEDGEIELSNNRAENGIRPFAVGRKNWLFSKTPNGAKASAVVYSVIETAKANGLTPFFYLKFLLERLPNISAGDADALDALMPWSDSLPDEVKNPTKI
jgi:transposase